MEWEWRSHRAAGGNGTIGSLRGGSDDLYDDQSDERGARKGQQRQERGRTRVTGAARSAEVGREGRELGGRGAAAEFGWRFGEIDDCEAASTFVQLQTFSPPPPSSSELRKARSRSPSPSRSREENLSPSKGGDLSTVEKERSIGDLSHGAQMRAEQQVDEVENDQEKGKDKVPRFVSNPKHLLMLALEFTMINAGKITSPLRPRAMIVRLDHGRAALSLDSGTRELEDSRLRWEV